MAAGEGKACEIDGCDRPLKARGLCDPHYKKWWKRNKPRVLEWQPEYERTCRTCGAMFLSREARTYCSRKCHYERPAGTIRPKQRATCICATCEKEFTRPLHEDQKRRQSEHLSAGSYCSLPCYRSRTADQQEVTRRKRAATIAWRAANRDHVQAYKREAYRRRQTETVNAETREYIAIIRRDPCAYCGGPADTIDHVQPIARGGGVQWDNLAPACRPCNSGKKDRTLLVHLLARVT